MWVQKTFKMIFNKSKMKAGNKNVLKPSPAQLIQQIIISKRTKIN